VACNGTAVTTGLNWTGAPTWTTPVAGEYTVSVSASSGNCSSKSVSCGTLTVHPKLTCGSVAQTITTGQTPTKPTVNCGTTAVTTGITWSPTSINSAITTAQTINNVTATATCGISQIANCSGTITVNAASACQYDPAECGNIAKGSVITAEQTITGVAGGKCYFATNATEILSGESGAGKELKINGQTVTSSYCSNTSQWSAPNCSKLADITKKDGGYYIYFGGYTNFLTTTNTFGGLNPNCQ